MAKRKLTPKLKDFLYDNRYKVKMSDYAGDALAYLKRLRAASKAAKTRKNKTAKIGSVTVPRNSELYKIIEASAKLKKQNVSTFIKENQEAIENLLQEGRVPITRETGYAIKDISNLPNKSKVFINGQQVSKGDAIYALQSLTSSAMQHTDTVVMNYEMSYDLAGNLYLELPTEEEVEEAESADDEGEMMDEMLDTFDTIIPIRSKGK
jgi:hypothetical protein